MRRREFIQLTAGSAAAALLPGCGRAPDASVSPFARRVLLVAFDGLDPRIVQSLMSAGRMPNFARLAKTGSLTQIATSNPPQTPVAFANIISGADPGLHQVFDFIHRDPNPLDSRLPVRPYFSTADAITSQRRWAIPLGSWQLPLSESTVELLRRGPAFWDYLVARGIDTQIYYLPSNYPPRQPEGPGRFRMMSGMGTPDLLGSYGEFTLFTPSAPRQGRSVGGGRFVFLSMLGNRGQAELVGPPNFLRRPDANGKVEPLKIVLDLVRDVDHRVAKIKVGDATVLLNEGEWSPWIPVELSSGIPGGGALAAVGVNTSLSGMVRLFLKQVFPKFELYVSPINIDPLEPINSLSVPSQLASDLARRHGRFYTLGIPEDTKALSYGALDEDQFQAQCELSMQERIAQYRQALSEFSSGCLFFYFGATDLLQHMFWRDRDERHPGRIPEQAARYAHVIDDLYARMDQLVGTALAAVGPDDLLIVLSDHGFTSFRRGFNLNGWLRDSGFLLQSPIQAAAGEGGGGTMFPGVNWPATRAYGLGMNGLYLNMAGREKLGVVRDDARRSLLAEVRDKLLEVRDVDGTPIVTNVKLTDELYPSADVRIAPDLIIGYNDGYRASWDTVLGGIMPALVEDNLDRWSGEHLIDPDLVPGVLVTSRPVTAPLPKLSDIAPTILAAFGIARPPQMTGQDLFADPRNPV
jgi:predicted AlkP superfamily phosphohydrolase/phosphomutase